MMSDDARDLGSSSSLRAFESGKYHALRRLGHGGMADVFLAVVRGPASVNKLVVIKRLKDDLAGDDEHRTMFLDEARLATRLNHPNVVQTYEVHEEGDVFFMTMEYLDGQPLNNLMRVCAREGRPLAPALCAHLCAEALAGLHYAHELTDFDGTPLKIVHRDVSPQNVFVTYDGQVKVVDFGIAKAEMSTTKTQAGVLKGKAAYMAPEQVMGESDRRADLFTMGIVLWELVTNRRLMATGSTAKTLIRVVRDDLPTPTDAGASLDPALEQIIMRALERDPDKRWQTADEMRDALEAYVESSGTFIRQTDIAALLQSLFAAERAEAQARIKEQMAGLGGPHPSGTMPAVRYGSQSALRVAVPFEHSASSIQTGSLGLHVSTLSSPIAVAPAPARVSAPPAKRTKLHALFLLLIGAGVGAYVGRARIATYTAHAPHGEERDSARGDEAREEPRAGASAFASASTSASASASAPGSSATGPSPAPSAAASAPSPPITAASSAAPEPAKAAARPVWRPHAPPPPPVVPAAPPSGVGSASSPAAIPERPVASAPPQPAPAPSPQGRRIRTDL